MICDTEFHIMIKRVNRELRFLTQRFLLLLLIVLCFSKLLSQVPYRRFMRRYLLPQRVEYISHHVLSMSWLANELCSGW